MPKPFNNVRVSRAYDYQSIHAQTIITFVFREHTIGLDEMTPTVSFPSACLSNKQTRTAQKAAAVKKKPAAHFFPKKKSFRIVGGDNQCESQIAVGKNQLRRVNALGRMAPRHAHVTLLASRRLLHNPGLRSVLDALRAYREDRAGKVGCNPAHFADVLKDSHWLFA